MSDSISLGVLSGRKPSSAVTTDLRLRRSGGDGLRSQHPCHSHSPAG